MMKEKCEPAVFAFTQPILFAYAYIDGFVRFATPWK